MLSVSCTYHHPTVNIASMWMHATMKSVLSWNNKTPKGGGSLALLSVTTLKARMGGDKELGAPASKRFMHQSLAC